MSDFIKCYTYIKSWKLGQILHCYAVYEAVSLLPAASWKQHWHPRTFWNQTTVIHWW